MENKKNMGVNKISKVKRLNINFIDFIKELKENKVSIEKVNKSKIESIYNSGVKLRFSNIERVFKRSNRKELNKELLKELKSRNISLEEFKKYGDNLINISNEKKLNYLSIEV